MSDYKHIFFIKTFIIIEERVEERGGGKHLIFFSFYMSRFKKIVEENNFWH
jgi:hypothetical protein